MKKSGLHLVVGLLLLVPAAGCHPRMAGKPVTPGSNISIQRHADLPIQFNSKIRDQESDRFLVRINKYRKQKGLKPLTVDNKLQPAAQWLSEDMAAKNYLGHRDSMGRDPFKRIAAFGYNYNTYKAENVAAGQETAAEVFKSWQESKTHNTNMLNPYFTVIGIGFTYSKKSRYGWYWATTFGGQKSKK
ncbi:CAP domain-containing protein [bacterium]|nr:CAP domain-containing protein [bacterium]